MQLFVATHLLDRMHEYASKPSDSEKMQARACLRLLSPTLDSEKMQARACPRLSGRAHLNLIDFDHLQQGIDEALVS